MFKFSLDLMQDAAHQPGKVVLLGDPGGGNAIHVRHRKAGMWKYYASL